MYARICGLFCVVALGAAVPAQAQPGTEGPEAEVSADGPTVAETETEETGLVEGEPTDDGSNDDAEVEVAQTEQTDDGPVMDLPPEADGVQAPSDDPAAGAAGVPRIDPLRGMQAYRLSTSSTAIGGYGELHLNVTMPDGADEDALVDLHRLVIFIAHRFNDDIAFYVELEVEHALVGDGQPGEVGVEQAYIDWELIENALTLRSGIVLVPMGVLNQWHEPPIFNGVERPRVDNRIIPTTWREAGIGFTGEPVEGLRYELYLMSGLDASGFSGSSGLRGGRQKVAKAATDGPALAARVEFEPTLGVVAGLSGYYGFSAGANTDQTSAAVPVGGVSVDARMRRAGIEARALLAYFSVGDTAELRGDLADPDDDVSDVSSAILGAYGEVGYDVLHLADTEHALVPFVRIEWYDTAFGDDAPSDPAEVSYDRASVTEAVFGLSYRPVPQFVFKTDYTLRRPSSGTDVDIFNAGVGWMF